MADLLGREQFGQPGLNCLQTLGGARGLRTYLLMLYAISKRGRYLGHRLAWNLLSSWLLLSAAEQLRTEHLRLH